MTDLPAHLKELANKLASQKADEYAAHPRTSHWQSVWEGAIFGFTSCFKILTEAAGDFDERAAIEGSGKHHDGTRRKFAEGARWQFERDRALMNLNKNLATAAYDKLKRLETRLAESDDRRIQELFISQGQFLDKLTAAEAKCKELEHEKQCGLIACAKCNPGVLK